MPDLSAENPVLDDSEDLPLEDAFVRKVDFLAAVVAPGSGPGDTVPPVVTLISPLDGRIEPSTEVVLEVTDNTGLRRVLLAARFPSNGLEELVHTGDRFTARFAQGSTRLAISGGWRYSLKRAGGWDRNLELDVYAIDTSGTEA